MTSGTTSGDEYMSTDIISDEEGKVELSGREKVRTGAKRKARIVEVESGGSSSLAGEAKTRKVVEERKEGKMGGGRRVEVRVERLAEKKVEGVQGEEEDLDKMIGRLQGELGKIREIIQREVGGKVSVTRVDQMVAMNAIMNVQDIVISTMRKQARLERVAGGKLVMKEGNGMGEEKEKERMRPRREVVSGDSEGEEWEKRKVRRRRTYAEASKGTDVSSSNGGGKLEGRVVVAGSQGWKTPPRVGGREGAIIVGSREEKDGKKLATALAKGINAREIGGAPRAVRVSRDGKVVIVPKDGVQQGKIKESLGRDNKLEVRETKRAEPLVVISGVNKGMEDGEFVEKLKRGLEGRTQGEVGGVKVVRRVGCRNPWKENVIVRVEGQGFKDIVKLGRVEIDCAFHYAEEYLGLSMCYRCCRFGHIMKFCGEKDVCHKCGGEHDGRGCSASFRRCVNGLRMYGKVKDHSARAAECPAMREILLRSRQNIRYDN